jgi:hypothetical protein
MPEKRGPGDAVHARLKAEVVDFEPRCGGGEANRPIRVSALLVQTQVGGQAAQGGAARIVAQVGRIGALVVARGGELRRLDGEGVAGDESGPDRSKQGVGVVLPAVEKVPGRNECAAA